MKADLSGDMASQVLMVLTPETDDEKRLLQKLATLTNRTCIVNHRGFNYMDPSVEFLVQKMPSGD